MDEDALYCCPCGEWHRKNESFFPPCRRELMSAIECIRRAEARLLGESWAKEALAEIKNLLVPPVMSVTSQSLGGIPNDYGITINWIGGTKRSSAGAAKKRRAKGTPTRAKRSRRAEGRSKKRPKARKAVR